MALPNYGWGGGIIQWIARGARFRATQHPLTVVKGDDAENTLRRYESLTHLSCIWFKSVCGGYLA